MRAFQSVVEGLQAIASEAGATATKLINPQDVIVAQWVKTKCQFGCRTFGRRFTCPPYAPTAEETVENLRGYEKAILVEFANLYRDKLREEPKRNRIQDALYNMERTAFLSGYEKAFCYEAGPCILCPECPAEKLENPNLFRKKECKRPKEARPSMEAAGIDVYSTVRRAGFDIHVVRDRSDAFKAFGLLLLE